MKGLLSLIVLSLFLGCTNHTNPPVTQTDTNKNLLQKDSLPLQTNAVNKFAAVDVSPMDISYFPSDYPVSKMSGQVNTQPLARIIYSRPHRQGRKIFGHLLKYGEPWRLGANEATELELFSPATIEGKPVNKGRYVLYCIPDSSQWKIIFNNNTFSWGLKPDGKKDFANFTAKTEKLDAPIEYFTIVFEKTATGADLVMAWENTVARLPIVFKQ